MEWVALADGVARWPLEKQRQAQEKSLTPEGGELQEKAGTLKKNAGDSFGCKNRRLAAAFQVTSFWGRACRLGRHRGGDSRPGTGPGNF